MMIRPFILAFFMILFTGCRAGSNGPNMDVYLVRHAEKLLVEDDPGLTEWGHKRAETLADILSSVDVTHIHSSDFIRTRDTAAPLAERLGIELEIYDPRDLPALAEKLNATGCVHLVVGHSNTTPPLVDLLGGDGGEPINEASEYDRLYIVSRKDGKIASQLIRYGPPG